MRGELVSSSTGTGGAGGSRSSNRDQQHDLINYPNPGSNAIDSTSDDVSPPTPSDRLLMMPPPTPGGAMVVSSTSGARDEDEPDDNDVIYDDTEPSQPPSPSPEQVFAMQSYYDSKSCLRKVII